MKAKYCISIALGVLLTILGTSCFAKQPTNDSKNVHGLVLGQHDVPLPGAAIYLKNLRTKTLESHIAEKDGGFRFPGLRQDVDYQLWAEYNGHKSDVKDLSSIDARPDIEVMLHIDASK